MRDNYEVRTDLLTAWEQGFVMGQQYAPKKAVTVSGAGVALADRDRVITGLRAEADSLENQLAEARNHIGIRDKALDKLVASRDGWKQSASEHKAELDRMTAERDLWNAVSGERKADRDKWEECARDLARRIEIADNDPDPARAYKLLAVNVTGEVKQWDTDA